MYLAHSSLKVDWSADGQSFKILLPWVEMEVDVEETEKFWIEEAIECLHSDPASPSVQKFFSCLQDYPLGYEAPRSLDEFQDKDLQSCPEKTLKEVDFASPVSFLKSLSVPYSSELLSDCLSKWSWDLEEICEASRIPGTMLYDPVSVVTKLICYRLNWESTSWSGQDGLGKGLEKVLNEDESLFFKKVGWISRQSHYVTTQFHVAVLPALTHFSKAEKQIQHFIQDEVGHYKFMDQTLEALGFKGAGDFSLGDANRWTLDVFERMGTVSPLAFSAMVNLFEAAYYEGQDPLSRVIKKSSRPEAARGYDLHYKINQEHRHCDMPVIFSKHIAPQTREHVELTTRLFELTLSFLDKMEERLLNGGVPLAHAA